MYINHKAWGDLFPKLVPERIAVKPRQQGLTMMLDRCHGLPQTTDLLALAGDYIDHIKLSFGTSVFMDEELLRRKIQLIRARQIDIFPGGTLMEATLVQGVYPKYLQRARVLGFSAIEISDGTISMSRQIRNDCIKRARDAGLKVISEVGKKDPTLYPSPAELCDQIGRDLAAGAENVILEARESGTGIGIYDEAGSVREDTMKAIVDGLGENLSKIIWEAPLKIQQTELVLRFGPNVNLGNIRPKDVLGLETLRCGLRFETFRHLVPKQESEETVDERRQRPSRGRRSA
jgi:phosphosulfolactate synthase